MKKRAAASDFASRCVCHVFVHTSDRVFFVSESRASLHHDSLALMIYVIARLKLALLLIL